MARKNLPPVQTHCSTDPIYLRTGEEKSDHQLAAENDSEVHFTFWTHETTAKEMCTTHTHIQKEKNIHMYTNRHTHKIKWSGV